MEEALFAAIGMTGSLTPISGGMSIKRIVSLQQKIAIF